jgi:hypothetical protein
MGIKKRFFVLWTGALLSGFYPWTLAQDPYVTNDGKSESSETSAPIFRACRLDSSPTLGCTATWAPCQPVKRQAKSRAAT